MKFKIPLIIGAALIGLGVTTSVVALAIGQFDFDELDGNIISKTYDITGEFTSIDVDLNTSDFNIYVSRDDTNKAVCLEKENVTFDIKVENNVLKIVENYEYELNLLPLSRKTDVSLFVSKDVYESLNIVSSTGDVDISDTFTFTDVNIDITTGDVSFTSKATNNINIKATTGDVDVYKATANNLTIDVSTGDVEIIESNLTGNINVELTTGDLEVDIISCNDFKCKTTTGDKELSNVTCNNINIQTTTGSTKLDNVIASGDMNIKSGSGDITFSYSDAKNIYVESTSGDVSGTITSDKVFNATSTSGNVKVPFSTTGGICQIKTTSGDIKISIE